MGLIATDTTQTAEFSLAEDQGADRTVFLLRPLDMRERAFITGRFAPGLRVRTKEQESTPTRDLNMTPETVVDAAVWAVRLGLRGWRNFLTGSGQAVAVQMETISIPGIGSREVLTEECVLRAFRKQWVDEISTEIMHMSELSGEQAKKLTLAFQVARYPSILKCAGGELLTVRDDATGDEEPITPDEAMAIVEEHRSTVQYIIDWESGLFTMSKAEYDRMPAVMVEARRIYNKVKNTPNGH